ncbi:MAG: nitroreductase/quinone reductase family protein [Dehalococcoidia bacterium]|nr:nitroreductase/quinone reductase family protein [Dehalococcoidia bacterium]
MSDRIETSTVEERHADEVHCYLTTTGRTSGQPHEIEIWFAPVGNTVYLMNGGGAARPPGQSDWVLNLRNDPVATVRIGDRQYRGVARSVEFDSDEHERARDMLVGKYQEGWKDLTEWRATAIPVAIDLMRE